MKTIRLFSYRGFLVHICHNGSRSHPYEWVIQPVESSQVKLMRRMLATNNQILRQTRWMRGKGLGWKAFTTLRMYDPTSMPSAFGCCSAADYAKVRIDDILRSATNPHSTHPVERLRNNRYNHRQQSSS